MANEVGACACCIVGLVVVGLIYINTGNFWLSAVIMFFFIVGFYALIKGDNKQRKKPVSQPTKPYIAPSQSILMQVKCQNCGFENNKEQAYCGKCGKPLATKNYNPQYKYYNLNQNETTNTCKQCGYIFSKENHFCGRCGAPASDGDQTKIY
jgi:uncharacterized OB-fold protein